MSSIRSDQQSTKSSTEPVFVPVTGSGRKTDHLKVVPECRCLRDRIREAVERMAASLDRSRPLVRHEVENLARRILTELDLSEGYMGWTMVAIGSAFWRDQVAGVPTDRRLLLLPRCMRDAAVCPAEMTVDGLQCVDCGACSLSALKNEAQSLGYRVMIAEGSPAVMKIILGGHVDAVLGVSCLDVLERTFDKILLAGIPCMAESLLSGGCENTSADEDRIRELFATPYRPAEVHTRSYVHLMRCAAQLFETDELARLLPSRAGGPILGPLTDERLDALDPIQCTEAIAYDFLARGGKHSRPFITLAAYDALSGDRCTGADGGSRVEEIPAVVKRMALAIESFHKASLVHDDIEDDDAFRYDSPTLHRRHGTATAINVGDYLVGVGYRLVSSSNVDMPPETTSDLLAIFSAAHTRLCEGQGAELIWRDAREKRLEPIDALKIYALKTAPAFQAALLAGLRLAGPVDELVESADRFSKHLGIAYQILNDLDDWNDPRDGVMSGKKTRGDDLLSGRPTILWALALQSLDASDADRLLRTIASDEPVVARIGTALELYKKADVFNKAEQMVARHAARALEVADAIGNRPLTHLMHFLVDAILDRRPLAINEG